VIVVVKEVRNNLSSTGVQLCTVDIFEAVVSELFCATHS